MTDEVLYKTIFRRKSVRKFRNENINNAQLHEIESFVASVGGLAGKAELAVVSGEQVAGGIFGVKAPHGIAAYAPPGRMGMMEAGFRLQQADLLLSAGGLGACYQGTAKVQGELASSKGLPCVMVLAFGLPMLSAHREDPSEFDRRSPTEVYARGLNPRIMEAARLAPSAMNTQPWYFDGTPDRIGVWKRKPGGVKGLAAAGLNDLDVGIAMLHLSLAAGHSGRQAVFDFAAAAHHPPEKGHEWICELQVI